MSASTSERPVAARAGSAGQAVAAVAPLLVAVGLLMAGTGLGSSLLGLRAGLEGFGTTATGLIMSGYYVGFVAGSVSTPRLIRQVGHIRVFSGLASLASVGVLVHVVLLEAPGWGLIRVVTGFCVAGLFVVTETWMNGSATNANRGRIIAAYMVVVTGGQALGQLLLNLADPAGFGAFVLTSVLVSLAVVPVALASVRAPEPVEPTPFSVRELVAVAPLAAVGAAVSGFTAAVVVGLGAVYASASGLSVARTSVLLFTTLLAAVLLQFPIGRLSDLVDRRQVIGAVSFVAAAAAVAATQLGGPDRFMALLPVAALAGGLSFTLYSLANAHLNDYLAPGALVSAGALMVLVNGAGAVAGPVLAAAVIAGLGADAFFGVLAVAYAVTGVYALYRTRRRAAVAPDQRASFVPLPSGAGPTVATLAPGAAVELYPAEDGEVARPDGPTLHWVARGSGDPVVLVHDAGSSAALWDETALTLADLGHLALAYDLRGHGASGRSRDASVAAHLEDLDTLLADRRIPVADVVGLGHGAVLAAAYAAAHPERVRTLVLVSADQVLAPTASRPARPLDQALQAGRGVLPAAVAARLEASTAYGQRRDPLSHRRLATDLRRADRATVAALRTGTRRAAAGGALLDQVAAPVLRVRGSRLGEAAPGVEVVAGAGHFVPLDDPLELGWVVDRFLTRHRAVGQDG